MKNIKFHITVGKEKYLGGRDNEQTKPLNEEEVLTVNVDGLEHTDESKNKHKAV